MTASVAACTQLRVSPHHAAPQVCLRTCRRHSALPTAAPRRCRRRWGATTAAENTAAADTAPAAAPPPLPFFPDRRCVEDVALPPLTQCHAYINLTNGVEAVPRLRALGLPYRFLRLPSTRCEQQQFEALINDLDGDLLMRLALGQTCLVYDCGSRNKKRGAPRAVWYGLEFIRYALRRLWLGECSPAHLRGYSVARVFEQHVAAFSNSTKKKVRYFSRYIPPGGLPSLHLYGVYAATSRDGDQQYYTALLRYCEGAAVAAPSDAGAAAAGLTHAAGEAARPPALVQRQVEEAVAAAMAPLQRLGAEQRQALLHGPDLHAAVEQLLGMRLWLGGVSHKQYHDWAARTGYAADGLVPPADL